MSNKVAIAGFYHETNTFASKSTELHDFESYQLEYGADLIEKYESTRTELGGMIQASRSAGLQLTPLLFAAAVPSGVITTACFQHLCQKLESLLEQSNSAGLLLVLHGAAVAEGAEDADGHLLTRLRQVLGETRPIVTTTDFHANISQQMFDQADVILGYDTFPHTDMFERGTEAVDCLLSMLKGETFQKSYRSVPLLTVPQRQGSQEQPVAGIMDRLHGMEASGDIRCGTVAMGFPYADTPHSGAAVLCYGSDEHKVRSAADDISAFIWSQRDDFTPQLTKLEELATALRAVSDSPIVLVDPADNIGGGSPGDGTAVLEALLAARVSGAVLVINDPQAAQTARKLGVGGRFAGFIGAKADQNHGQPVHVEGTITHCSEVSYRHSGSYMTGFVTQMGLCALIETSGLKVLLTSLRTMPFDIEQLRAVGLEPSQERIIVVKSATAWRAAYEPIAKQIIYLDTPGVCPSNLHRLAYHTRRRPIYPLETDFRF